MGLSRPTGNVMMLVARVPGTIRAPFPCPEANGASGLATGQPRKPKAALVVDWFYALPPYEWLPREGDRF